LLFDKFYVGEDLKKIEELQGSDKYKVELVIRLVFYGRRDDEEEDKRKF